MKAPGTLIGMTAVLLAAVGHALGPEAPSQSLPWVDLRTMTHEGRPAPLPCQMRGTFIGFPWEDGAVVLSSQPFPDAAPVGRWEGEVLRFRIPPWGEFTIRAAASTPVPVPLYGAWMAVPWGPHPFPCLATSKPLSAEDLRQFLEESERLRKMSEKLAEESEKLRKASERSMKESERLLKESERLRRESERFLRESQRIPKRPEGIVQG